MIDFVNIFQNFAFPIAACVVLFYFAVMMIKRELKQNEETQKEVNAANERFTNYLQQQNEKLTNIIQDNTQAYKKLVDVLDDIKLNFKKVGYDRK